MSIKVVCPDFNGKKSPCAWYIHTPGGGYCKRDYRFQCIEYIRRKQPRLSYSTIEKYVRCRRYYYYYNIMGLVAKGINLTPKLGNVLHSEMAVFHNIDDDDSTKHALLSTKQRRVIIDAYRDEEGNTPNWLMRELANIDGVMSSYRLLDDTIVIKPIGLCEFKGDTVDKDNNGDIIMYRDGIHILSYLDLLIKSDRHAYDFKYTSNPDYYNFFTTEIQASTYFLVFPKLNKITFRLVRKPELKLGKNESIEEYQLRLMKDVNRRPKYYFEDKTFYRTEYDLDYTTAYIKFYSTEISRNLDYGKPAFPQERNGCYQYNSWCEYMPICTSGVVSDDLFDRRQIEDIMYERSK